MDTKQLQTFLVVAKVLNFNEAARSLNYSQSTVSDHIHNLEQQLGVKLFERLGKKIFLNACGSRLVPLADRMVREAGEMEALFSDAETIGGTLTIGAAESLCAFWLPPILKEYRQLYPKVQVIIKVANCLEFSQGLRQNEIDLAFSLHDESAQEYIRQVELFHGKTVFVASPDNPLAHRPSVGLEALQGALFLLPEADCAYRRDLEEQLAAKHIPLQAIMEFGSIEAIKNCVKHDLGISLLPAMAVQAEIQEGTLAALAWSDSPVDIQAYMLFHREKWLSPPIKALEAVVTSYVAKAL